MVKGDPAKRCCKANMLTPLVFDKPATAAKDAAAALVLEDAPPVNPAPLRMEKPFVSNVKIAMITI